MHRLREDAGEQLDDRVASWLRLVRWLLHQAEEPGRRNGSVYGMTDAEVCRLTLRMEMMKRNGTWGRPPNEEHPSSCGASGVNRDVSEEEEVGRVGDLSILPEEIWLKIMDELSDPADLWSCDNTCQLFEKLLRPWKAGWMLGQALPFIYRYLSKDEILRCRNICKSWRDAVDNFLENHPSLRPYQKQEGYHMRLDFVCPLKEKKFSEDNMFWFCNDPQNDNSAILEKERFQRREQNPFIGRFVYVMLGNQELDDKVSDQPEDPWWERFYQFLSTFGKEIWRFSLKFPIKPNQSVQNKLSSFLVSFLFQSMPHLRKLTIDTQYCRFDNTLVSADMLPKAPMLESLELMSWEVIGMKFNSLLHPLVTKYASNQLQKLRIGGPNFVRVREMGFENLKELIIDVGGTAVSAFDQLNAFSDFRMERLSKIHLIFPWEHNYYLFEDLVDFVNTMTALTQLSSLRLAGHLSVFRIGTAQELATRRRYKPKYNCNASSLTTIEVDLGNITFVNGPRPMRFEFLLRYFPQIKNLSIFARQKGFVYNSLSYDSDMEVDVQQKAWWKLRNAMSRNLWLDDVVDLYRYVHEDGDMYKSRVWGLLNTLNLLTIQWDAFTREGYEAYKRMQSKD